MHDIDLLLADQCPGEAPGPFTEEGIRGTAIDHRRSPSPGERECAVWNDPCRYPWLVERRTATRWCSRNQRDSNSRGRQVVDEIVDAALQPAQPVQRKYRSRNDGDVSRLRHLRRRSRSR